MDFYQMDWTASLNAALRKVAADAGLEAPEGLAKSVDEIQPSLSRQSTNDSENWSIYSGGSHHSLEPVVEAEEVAVEAEEELEIEKEDSAVPCASHKVQEVMLAAPAKCSGCGRVQQGVSVFQCATCSEVKCLSCHWMDMFSMQVHMEMEMSGASSSSQEACESVSATPAVAVEQCVGEECSVGTLSSRASKQCSRCKVPWRGFGDLCADCRSCGPSGSVRTCRLCGTCFVGFGGTCGDCALQS